MNIMKSDEKMLDDLWVEILETFSGYANDNENIRVWYDKRKNSNKYSLEERSCDKEIGNEKTICRFYQRAGAVIAKPELDQSISIENFEDEIDNI